MDPNAPPLMIMRLEICAACDLAMQGAKDELKELDWNDSIAKLDSLSESFEFLDRYPEFGGALDFRILKSLNLLVQKYDDDLHQNFDIMTPLEICTTLGRCDPTLVDHSKNECDSCLEGGCTSFGYCMLGNGRNKRRVVVDDHPLIHKLTPDMYGVLYTREMIEERNKNLIEPKFEFHDNRPAWQIKEENKKSSPEESSSDYEDFDII
eukprot:CAMPEP_0116998692 /NCGR_PEP_ID=MMETSP0472-20121206/1676_1 /TAXON_ID=693140 ORGANISM="Tiarina fusus, Strain LIS" /NCGR_SAMPLE_ID=MMETSP0472 /ASSEMBLY_ACC=CAM_ASM_000603 /LENGTH=207 /DNA_ID=CAMNT_0004697923 /DNA_START=77 /DNA_END=700 /DNA_ORIENTATION=+